MLVKVRGSMGKKRSTIFKEVPAGYGASGYIAEGAQAGLINGYPDKNYRPEQKVSQAAGQVILSRFSGQQQTGRPQPNVLLTRAEVAELLYQTKAVQDLLSQDVLSWSTY